jgi:hypothetical protein
LETGTTEAVDGQGGGMFAHTGTEADVTGEVGGIYPSEVFVKTVGIQSIVGSSKSTMIIIMDVPAEVCKTFP